MMSGKGDRIRNGKHGMVMAMAAASAAAMSLACLASLPNSKLLLSLQGNALSRPQLFLVRGEGLWREQRRSL